jgi:hypothetical protein
MSTLKCSACNKEFDQTREGVELWNAWFCSMCFLGQAQNLHREIRPEDIEVFRTVARELAGYLPSGVFEMILVGFYHKATGKNDPPPREALVYSVAELQRLFALNNFQRELKILQTWQDMFTEFTEGRQRDIQDMVKKLTDPE